MLCLGKATRLIPYIEEAGGAEAKEYEARVRFGFETTTDDVLGEPRGSVNPSSAVTQAALREALKSFVGELQQVPPAFSAKKVDGERAYAIARRGDEVDLKAVSVTVARAELLALEGDVASLRFACSRGTYIRALARDLGRALGTGAHLVALRRTRSGEAGIEAAVPLDQLSPSTLSAALKPLVAVLRAWPKVTVGDRDAADLRLGRAINVARGAQESRARVRVCDAQDDLIALANAQGARLQPFCVF